MYEYLVTEFENDIRAMGWVKLLSRQNYDMLLGINLTDENGEYQMYFV